MRIAVLLSGGLDSTVAMYQAARSFPQAEIWPLFVKYNQYTESEEYRAAFHAACALKAELTVISLLGLSGSSLVTRGLGEDIPRNRTQEQMKVLPSTYVPARNLVLISLGASFAEANKCSILYVGFSSYGDDDVIGWRLKGKRIEKMFPASYPDTTDRFARSIERTIRIGSCRGPLISAPLLDMSKREIVTLGRRMGVSIERTWSCYAGTSKPCGECDACNFRAKAIASQVD